VFVDKDRKMDNVQKHNICNFMELNPSSEVANCAASQEIASNL
jgi:hypothetical protein